LIYSLFLSVCVSACLDEVFIPKGETEEKDETKKSSKKKSKKKQKDKSKQTILLN